MEVAKFPIALFSGARVCAGKSTRSSPRRKLAKVAQQQGISVEQLKKDEDFDPYLNLKVALVEEGGQLKIGYFEFLPPSMLD